jgi:VanZ family protein
MDRTRRWTPSAAWSAVILIATSIPGALLRGAPFIPGGDKVVHALLYGTFGYLVCRGVEASGVPGMRRVVTLLAMIGVFAAFDEWHQQFIPGRSTEVADWMADMAGATVGMTISRTALWRRGPVL